MANSKEESLKRKTMEENSSETTLEEHRYVKRFHCDRCEEFHANRLEDANEFKIFEELLEKSIRAHTARCVNNERYKDVPRRSEPWDQFVSKTFQSTVQEDRHCQHMLMPCGLHSYCKKCLFERYKEDPDQLHLGDENVTCESWIWFPPLFKPYLDENADENYPECSLFYPSGLSTFGMIKIRNMVDILHFVAEHGLPTHRMSVPEEISFNSGTPQYISLYFY